MDVYWPREHSSRKRGTPAKMSVRKYGIRKAPGSGGDKTDGHCPQASEEPAQSACGVPPGISLSPFSKAVTRVKLRHRDILCSKYIPCSLQNEEVTFWY